MLQEIPSHMNNARPALTTHPTTSSKFSTFTSTTTTTTKSPPNSKMSPSTIKNAAEQSTSTTDKKHAPKHTTCTTTINTTTTETEISVLMQLNISIPPTQVPHTLSLLNHTLSSSISLSPSFPTRCRNSSNRDSGEGGGLPHYACSSSSPRKSQSLAVSKDHHQKHIK